MKPLKLSFTTRLIVLVSALSVGATLVSSALLTWTNYRATIQQAAEQGESIAHLLAKSARLARVLPAEVEEILAQHMVITGQLVAQFVDVAEKAGLSADDISRRLTKITESKVLDEFWITDEKGHAYIRKLGSPDFTFSPSGEQQPQAHEFWKLLSGESAIVVQQARKREIDQERFKYVGVSGVDKPRIVQVGYNARFIDMLDEHLGLQRTIDNLISTDEIDAIFVFNKEMDLIASPKSGTEPVTAAVLAPDEIPPIRSVIISGESRTLVESDKISVIAPIRSDDGATVGAALIRTPTAHIKMHLDFQLKVAAAIATSTAILGALMASWLARRQAAPLLTITKAARDVEARQFSPHELDEIEKRDDEVGQLGRVFKEVAQGFLDKERTLDALVKERTTALEERNTQLETLSTRLSKYLSPQIYGSLFKQSQFAAVAAKRKKLTIFFSDIVNFSEITEQAESEDITRILNEYLNEMARIALHHGATIDKYVGDAVMIFFGDPETRGVKEDAENCIAMAIDMQNMTRRLRHRWRTQGFDHPFEVRMGVNTGYCTVGDFGSDERMDYTIIGHQVNLAARLEQAAKPGAILISHETYSLVKDMVEVDEQQEIFVKGSSSAIRTYRVVDLQAAKTSVIEEEQPGLSLKVDFAATDREEAKRLLESVLERLQAPEH